MNLSEAKCIAALVLVAAQFGISRKSIAEPLPDGFEKPAALRKQLTKRHPCSIWMFAVVDVPELGLDKVTGTSALCVFNTNSGCALGFYDAESGSYAPVQTNESDMDTADGKRCTTKVALSLMGSRPWFAQAPTNLAKLVMVAFPHVRSDDHFEFGGSNSKGFKAALQAAVCKDLPYTWASALDCPAI